MGRNGAQWGKYGRPHMSTLVPAQNYVGNFQHTLDAKNRLTIPAEWRSVDGAESFLALPHPEGYIAVLPPEEVQALRAKVAQKALSDREAQDTLNRLFSRAFSFSYDKQGRVGLPDALLAHAGIKKDAVLNGTLTKFGIWSPDRWSKVEQRTDGENYADAMRRMGI